MTARYGKVCVSLVLGSRNHSARSWHQRESSCRMELSCHKELWHACQLRVYIMMSNSTPTPQNSQPSDSSWDALLALRKRSLNSINPLMKTSVRLMKRCWRIIPKRLIKELILSMPRRPAACRQAKASKRSINLYLIIFTQKVNL
jgi:hypothetical protein